MSGLAGGHGGAVEVSVSSLFPLSQQHPDSRGPGTKDGTSLVPAWDNGGTTNTQVRALLGQAGTTVGQPRPPLSRRPTTLGSGTDGTSKVGTVKISTRWLWEDRLPLGEPTLLTGPPGIGKSVVAGTLAADVTRGLLAGEFLGIPRPVVIVATDDNWETTVGPRLMAAGADLTLVYRVEVCPRRTARWTAHELREVECAVVEVDAALVLLDPLRLTSRRAALLAGRTGCAVIGTCLPGERRARSVLPVRAGSGGQLLLGLSSGSLPFRIVGAEVPGAGSVAAVKWEDRP